MKPLQDYWNSNQLPMGGMIRNKTVYWSNTDTLKNFKDNPRPGYTATSITYTYNLQGFRTKNFDLESHRPRVYFLGCSHVEGIGLRNEDTTAAQLFRQYQDSDCYNLGVSSCSGDTVVRLLANMCRIMPPQAVYILWPDQSRFELYDDYGLRHMGPWSIDRDTLPLFHDLQQLQVRGRNRLLLELLQHKYKFDLSEAHASEYVAIAGDYARDSHFGPKAHKRMATLMWERLKTYVSEH